ncbi:MAG: aminopeptidase [Patescibacteria group bacterium]
MALTDPRVKKQAEVLVDYSLKVKKGERVIVVGDFEAKPLMLEIYKLLIKRGAGEVRLHFDSYEFTEAYFKNASDSQIQIFPRVLMEEIKKMDCYIRIGSESNTRGLSALDATKISKRARVIRPITDYRVENTRWVVTRFPTEAQAQEADMSLEDYQDFVFDAITKVDWKKKFKEQERLRKIIDLADTVRIVGAETDLRVRIKGRKAVNAYGSHNMPDGEVFTSVIEESSEGFISFTYPALYLGKEFHNIRLEFEKGKVVKATAEKGEKDLNKILDMDKGARFIGELGIGNNFKIKRFTKSILFDEKIGGSVHLALGKGYKETLSKNKSALHWDMICDLRQGGEVWFDNKLVQRNGKWLI